jgi:hypothetical protein
MDDSGLGIETPPHLADQRLQSLYEYWLALARAAGGLPPVQAFDPLHLPRLLANLWIMEVEPETYRFRMRLAGENINAIYRRNIGGHYFSDVFQPSEIDMMVARYTRAMSEPAIVPRRRLGLFRRRPLLARGTHLLPDDRAQRPDRHHARHHDL